MYARRRELRTVYGAILLAIATYVFFATVVFADVHHVPQPAPPTTMCLVGNLAYMPCPS